MLDIIVFNVEHGQSIFFYPHDQPQYGMFVDCGNASGFEPVDTLLRWGWLPADQSGRPTLGNLTLTNYDHDHFSGLPYLMGKVSISSIRFARNLSTQELVALKPERTAALDKICYLQDTYTDSAPHHIPPYTIATFSLPKHCFPNGVCSTNNLSQIVFVSFGGSVICICGDVEAAGWAQLLLNDNFKAWLRATNILVASHHGRQNGHAEEIFAHCSPECVILSDKQIVHGTQEGMSQAYANRISGNGILLGNPGLLSTLRKVLTTRNDGHLLVRFYANGVREYRRLV